jgi:aminoglycoside phosphotransferase (APT) family kinase protein
LTGANLSGAQGEFRTLSLLHKAGYPVPQVYALGEPAQAFGQPFIIMQCVQGGQYAYRFPKTPQEDQTPLRAFIALFRRLHTLVWRPLVENPDEMDPPNQPFFHFDHQLSIFSNYFSRADFSDLDPALSWLVEQRPRAACERASVIHYDFHPDNILEDKNGKLYVIDWTSAEISDYRFDLAWTLTLALAYRGDTFRKMILEEYQLQLGGQVPELNVFEAAAIVRRIGIMMISMGIGSEKLGMRPEAVQAMRRDREPLQCIYNRLQKISGLKLPQIKNFLSGL